MLDGLSNLWNEQGLTIFTLITMQIMVIISSFTLAVLMIKYHGKRALDVALLLREIAILFIIGRAFAFWAFDWHDPVWSLAGYAAMAVAAFLVIALLLREHYINRNTKG